MKQILYENSEFRIERASSNHPGFDSAIDVVKGSGDLFIGHKVPQNGFPKHDCFGTAPLGIFCVLPDDSIVDVYEFGWRWSPSGERNVLGWWFGDSEWDVTNIQKYGKVVESIK